MQNFLKALGAFFASLANPVTVDQYMGQLRIAIPALGGIAVAAGWIPADVMNTKVQSLLAIIGPIMIVAGSVWSLIANNKSSIIAAAAKMPETQHKDGNIIVITDPALAQTAKKAAAQADKPNG